MAAPGARGQELARTGRRPSRDARGAARASALATSRWRAGPRGLAATRSRRAALAGANGERRPRRHRGHTGRGGQRPRRARTGTLLLAGGAALRRGSARRWWTMRIAIVGAGVSGLVCAHLLSGRHDVTVFEANDYAGGHTNTVRVDTARRDPPRGHRLHRPERPHLSELRAAARPARRGHSAIRHELLGLGRRRLRVQRLRGERPVRAALASGAAVLPPDDPRPDALQPRGAGARRPERKRARRSASSWTTAAIPRSS